MGKEHKEEASQRSGALNTKFRFTGAGDDWRGEGISEAQGAAGKRQEAADLAGAGNTGKVSITGAGVTHGKLTALSRWLGVPRGL